MYVQQWYWHKAYFLLPIGGALLDTTLACKYFYGGTVKFWTVEFVFALKKTKNPWQFLMRHHFKMFLFFLTQISCTVLWVFQWFKPTPPPHPPKAQFDLQNNSNSLDFKRAQFISSCSSMNWWGGGIGRVHLPSCQLHLICWKFDFLIVTLESLDNLGFSP